MDEDLIERFYGPRQLIRACYLRETDVVLGANRDGDQYWSLARVGCSGHPTNTSLLTIRRVVDMAGLAEEWNRPWTDEQKAERRRLAEQARRIAAVKTGLLISSVVLGLLVVGAGGLYLAVRLVRLAWGGL